jgi:uncharacterized membrane protein YeiH
MIKADGESLLFAVDLAGTLLFAVEGGSAATSGGLDLLGVLVLAFATALGGGIIRDLLIKIRMKSCAQPRAELLFLRAACNPGAN